MITESWGARDYAKWVWTVVGVRAAQALDARLTNHVVAPSVNPALGYIPN